MIKNLEHVSGTKKRLSIEIPADVMEREVASALASVRGQARIPGFRPGKAPMTIIEKRFGKEAEGEAIERAIPRYYGEALKESALTPVSDPLLEGAISYTRGQALNVTFALEVMPAIEPLKYDGIKVKKMDPKVEDKDIDDTLERLRSERASVEPTDDPAAEGDLVVIDYEGDGGVKKIEDEVFKIGSDLMPRAFSDCLIGKKKGESAECSAAFPEDFYAKEHAGQTRNFKITVKEVKRVTLPAMDDDFAKDLNFDNMAALRDLVRKRLEDSQKEGITRLQRADLLRQLVEGHEFEVPESILHSELEALLGKARTQNKIANPEAQDESALAEQLKPNATRNAKANVIIRAIGMKESVDVTEDDLKKHVLGLAMRINLPPDNIIKYYVSRDGSVEGLRREVFEDKVLDLVYSKAEFVPMEGASI